MKLKLGSVESPNYDLSAQSDNSFLRYFLALDEECYYDEFFVPDLKFEVIFSSIAGAQAFLNDAVIAPATRIGGSYYQALGGGTPFKLDDVFTSSVTSAEATILQHWFSYRSGLSTALDHGFALPSDNAGYHTVAE
jgi:hypothetical protein